MLNPKGRLSHPDLATSRRLPSRLLSHRLRKEREKGREKKNVKITLVESTKTATKALESLGERIKATAGAAAPLHIEVATGITQGSTMTTGDGESRR